MNSVSWEEFVSLLTYTGRASAALYDLYSAPLRLILNDPVLASKLQSALPKQLLFKNKVACQTDNLEFAEEKDFMAEKSGQITTNPDSFDIGYNGLNLISKKLSPDVIDGLRLQCILRTVFLRLDYVKHLRKAAMDVSLVYAASARVNDVVNRELEELATQSKVLAAGQTPAKSVTFKPSDVDESVASKSSTAPQFVELSCATMQMINTPRSKSRTKNFGLNKDAIFSVTTDFCNNLEMAVQAALQLETTELFALDVAHKVAILKVLCDSCYESTRIRDLLAKNAEERVDRIQALNRAMKEQKLKLKETSSTKRALALELCRKQNMEQAANKDKDATVNQQKKATVKPKKGTNSVVKDEFDPSPEQLQTMIDDLIVLENYGLQTFIDDFPLEDVSSDDEGSSDAEDGLMFSKDMDFPVRKGSASARARSLERKRLHLEKQERNNSLQNIYTRLQYAVESKSEKELRGAVRAAERLGLKGVDEKGKSFCTVSLKQVRTALNFALYNPLLQSLVTNWAVLLNRRIKLCMNWISKQRKISR